MSNRYDKKNQKAGPSQQANDQDQEQEAPAVEAPETEQQRMQNQMGNQAVGGMITSKSTVGFQRPGGGSVEFVDKATSEEKDMEGPIFGGDDDPLDPGVLTIEDLTRSWNPGIKRGKDRPKFIEPMPDDELPPEDKGFREVITTWKDPIDLPPSRTLDALLQPSPPIVAAALCDWSRGVGRWMSNRIDHRTMGRLIAPGAPVLQDPHGRVLIGRARAGAIGTWCLLDSPAVTAYPSPMTCALIDFCLEVEGRMFRARRVRHAIEDSGQSLPEAVKILEEFGGRMTGVVVLRTLSEAANTALTASIDQIIDLDDPMHLVPNLVNPEPIKPDPDDPLGLDAVLETMTGPKADPVATQYEYCIMAAERIAAAASRLRVHMAGACASLADVARLWSSGAPGQTMLNVLKTLDNQVLHTLQLLVEIVRAAKRRTVSTKGVRNGLRRTARSLNAIRRAAIKSLLEVIGGILPANPPIPAPNIRPEDPLWTAWNVGQPSAALSWIDALPASLNQQVAYAFTRASAGDSPAELEPVFLRLREQALDADRPFLSSILGICLGSCYLRNRNYDGAHGLAVDQLEHARRRRNGMAVAEAALLGMEAHVATGDLTSAKKLQGAAGSLLWHMGADGALTLLARWTPPEDELIH